MPDMPSSDNPQQRSEPPAVGAVSPDERDHKARRQAILGRAMALVLQVALARRGRNKIAERESTADSEVDGGP